MNEITTNRSIEITQKQENKTVEPQKIWEMKIAGILNGI